MILHLVFRKSLIIVKGIFKMDENLEMVEEWYTLDAIEPSETDEKLYCISVESPMKQFLIGEIKTPTHNSEMQKEEDALKGEAVMIIGSIARLGRAAGVHLILATQRPDAKLIAGETKANLGVRINCGRTDSNASSMILGTSEGTRVKANPKGRLYLSIYQQGDHGQGFFAGQEWIDDYLKSQGLNPDGTPLSQPRSKLAHIADMSTFDEADLDSISGIDTASVIEKIREEEEAKDYYEDDDFGFEDNVEVAPAPYNDGDLVRPELNAASKKQDFGRPEDSWDIDLEDLINENNE